jgi:hypothetical protein
MTLEEMRQAQIAHGHHEQAKQIAKDLEARFPALEISGPEDWESGQYVCVFVTLIDNVLRMMIQLTYSDKDRHYYQLKPASTSKEDIKLFTELMRTRFSEVEPLADYARVPDWPREGTSNTDFETIAKQVLVALAFVANVPTPRWE